MPTAASASAVDVTVRVGGLTVVERLAVAVWGGVELSVTVADTETAPVVVGVPTTWPAPLKLSPAEPAPLTVPDHA